MARRAERWGVRGLLFLLVLGAVAGGGRPAMAAPPAPCELVVLAATDDLYYPLAEEIAAAEGAPIAPTLDAALACDPTYLIWVAAPGRLSDAAMIAFGQAMQAHRSAVASGLITGSTLDHARALWARRTEVRGAQCVAINAANPAAHIYEGQILNVAGAPATTAPLTKPAFRDVLATADYVTFTGHGGKSYLRLDERTTLSAVDVPELDGVVISTGSCNTFRPWSEDAIARRFADRGAAAYAGFAFSPNEGYLIGEFAGLPFRYTWPAFPIGYVVQVQNRGTVQGFAKFPYRFLLGDPRIALQAAPPYAPAEDRVEGARRVLTYSDVPAGAIPLRIAGGAAYRFVKVPGLTAAADGDPFYNSRLQMVNGRADKYLLVVHPGGELRVELRRRAPWHWFPMDVLLDSLDHTFIFAPQSEGDVLTGGFALLPLAWAGVALARRRLGWREVRVALAVGAGAALLQAAYVALRLDDVTITSKTVVFSPLSIAAAFVLGACGTLIYLRARGWLGRAVALLTMTFASWVPLVFGVLALVVYNRLGFIPHVGTAIYNLRLGLLPAGATAVTLALAGGVLAGVGRRSAR